MIERSRVRVPAGAVGEFSSPGWTFCADSYFGISSTPVLPQCSNPVLPQCSTPVLPQCSTPVLPQCSTPVLPWGLLGTGSAVAPWWSLLYSASLRSRSALVACDSKWVPVIITSHFYSALSITWLSSKRFTQKVCTYLHCTGHHITNHINATTSTYAHPFNSQTVQKRYFTNQERSAL